MDIWLNQIKVLIDRLEPAFTRYSQTINGTSASLRCNNILDDEEDTDRVSELEQITNLLNQLHHILGSTETEVPAPVEENPLAKLAGTLKKIIPPKHAMAMWFHTEMMTDPTSIYFSPNIGPNAWKNTVSSPDSLNI